MAHSQLLDCRGFDNRDSRELLRTSPGAVVAAVVRHALGEGVCDLVLDSVAIAVLEDRLKSIILHRPDRSRTRDLRNIRLEGRISREEDARCCAGLCHRGSAHKAGCTFQELLLEIRNWNHQMSSMLSHVADLECPSIRKLLLNGQVPLLRKSRLDMRIPHSDERTSKRVAG